MFKSVFFALPAMHQLKPLPAPLAAPPVHVAPGASHLVAVEWYDGTGGPPAAGSPVLALALDNGRMQLMQHEMDDGGICVDTGLRVKQAKWSHDGTVSTLVGMAGLMESWQEL